VRSSTLMLRRDDAKVVSRSNDWNGAPSCSSYYARPCCKYSRIFNGLFCRKVYPPGRVNIYLVDAGTSPEVPKLLHLGERGTA
jgi:hypothetical protein